MPTRAVLGLQCGTNRNAPTKIKTKITAIRTKNQSPSSGPCRGGQRCTSHRSPHFSSRAAAGRPRITLRPFYTPAARINPIRQYSSRAGRRGCAQPKVRVRAQRTERCKRASGAPASTGPDRLGPGTRHRELRCWLVPLTPGLKNAVSCGTRAPANRQGVVSESLIR